MAKKINAELAEQVRAEIYREASERWIKLQKKKQKQNKLKLNDEWIERVRTALVRGDAVKEIKLDLKQIGEACGAIRDGLNVVRNVLKEPALPGQFNSDLNVLADTYGKAHSVIQAWEDEAKKLFDATENVGISDVNQLTDYIRNNPPSAGAIALLLLVAQDKYKENSEKKCRDDFQRVREQGTAAKKKHAKPVHEYIADLNDDLIKKPLPKVGLGLDARANYICDLLPKFRVTKKNGKPYKISYVRNLIIKLDKINQT